jgi:hypothetical protein
MIEGGGLVSDLWFLVALTECMLPTQPTRYSEAKKYNAFRFAQVLMAEESHSWIGTSTFYSDSFIFTPTL